MTISINSDGGFILFGDSTTQKRSIPLEVKDEKTIASEELKKRFAAMNKKGKTQKSGNTGKAEATKSSNAPKQASSDLVNRQIKEAKERMEAARKKGDLPDIKDVYIASLEGKSSSEKVAAYNKMKKEEKAAAKLKSLKHEGLTYDEAKAKLDHYKKLYSKYLIAEEWDTDSSYGITGGTAGIERAIKAFGSSQELEEFQKAKRAYEALAEKYKEANGDYPLDYSGYQISENISQTYNNRRKANS